MTPKPESVATMAAYDRLSPEFRKAIANAPYAFRTSLLHSLDHLQAVTAAKLQERDFAKVGPVPLVYRRKMRRRR